MITGAAAGTPLTSLNAPIEPPRNAVSIDSNTPANRRNRSVPFACECLPSRRVRATRGHDFCSNVNFGRSARTVEVAVSGPVTRVTRLPRVERLMHGAAPDAPVGWARVGAICACEPRGFLLVITPRLFVTRCSVVAVRWRKKVPLPATSRVIPVLPFTTGGGSRGGSLPW